ncbi:MAG: hypothetical protein D6714_01735 [Bacteroidetes bacterium]|nr:MAG: hypothetical protein D6714_01735 [Bacteroidota bacterium]
MKYTKALLGALCALVLFTGCFEVREEVNVKEDGTGDMKLVINLSESKDNVRKYLGMEVADGVEVPKEENIEKILNHVLVVARGVKGLSNVAVESDYTDFIFSFTARFDNINAVNTAVTEVTRQLSYLFVPPIETKNFDYSGDKFIRYFDYPISPKEYQSLPSMQRYVLETARAVSIYRFGRPIKDYSNKKAVLSPSGKAIKLEAKISELASGTATFANQISF